MNNQIKRCHPGLRRKRYLDDKNSVTAAINAAHYHRNNLLRITSTPQKKWLPVYTNILHWEVRAFFWELVAAFDMLLHWCNERFELGIREREVNWRSIKDIAHSGIDQDLWNDVRHKLCDVRDTDWYFEVSKYRNFTHSSFLEIQSLCDVEGNEPPQCFIQRARNGQGLENVLDALKRYLEEFSKFNDEIWGLKGVIE